MIIVDPYFENIQKHISTFKQYRKTHPNISMFWITYLQDNIENYNQTIQDAERALHTLKTLEKDIPLVSILTLLCLFNQNNDNT
tara:strand:+ start:269 stop:520 length:252 start_codon:yes stop_codon:yes gene_type:complete